MSHTRHNHRTMTIRMLSAGLAVMIASPIVRAQAAASDAAMPFALSWARVSDAGERDQTTTEPDVVAVPEFRLATDDSAGTSAATEAGPQEDHSTGDLAKQTQNPVADLISVPFQNNTNFEVGPRGREQNVLNIQPVIPIHLNNEWNLITRTIVPLIYQPAFRNEGDDFGLGDVQFSGFLSPAKTDKFIWGAGPVLRFPTATDNRLGSDKWSAGPSAVALVMDGPWVVGGLVQNLFSYAGKSSRPYVNEFLLQPFINYNLPKGWYLTSAPIITADWNAEKYSDAWTIPVGGGAGRVFHIGKLPVNLQTQAFYNVESPSFGPDWTLRVQLQFLFPE